MARTPERAILEAEKTTKWRAGWCLNVVRTMYGLPPDTDDDNRDGVVDGLYAYQQWLSIPASHKHPTADPAMIPRGSLVFFSSGKMGHVAIGLGGGRCRGTWNDQVLTHTIAYIVTRGYTLLGWTDYLSDTTIAGIKPVTPLEEDEMKMPPALDWRRKSRKVDPWTSTVQGLMQARGFYLKYKIDGKRGAGSIAEFARFQIAYNCGDSHGHADKLVGDKSWESLIFGRKW